jgi:hypothetical protein
LPLFGFVGRNSGGYQRQNSGINRDGTAAISATKLSRYQRQIRNVFGNSMTDFISFRPLFSSPFIGPSDLRNGIFWQDGNRESAFQERNVNPWQADPAPQIGYARVMPQDAVEPRPPRSVAAALDPDRRARERA